MTAKDIQRRLIFDLYKRSFVIPNYTPKGWWECDLFELTEAAFFREYEIKISRADFKSDASKSQTRAHWRTNLYANAAELETTDTKHSLLAERSVRGPSNFSFVVPDGLIEPSELPEWAGLIYASASKGNHRPPWNVRLLEVKKAPRLHIEKADRLREHAESVCYYRMNNLYMRGDLKAAEFESLAHLPPSESPALEIV